MATLYLHIGTPKTGTSAIQCFCMANAEALAKRGVCFPIIPKEILDFRPWHNAHFMALESVDENGNFADAAEAEAWRRGIAYVTRLLRAHERVLLSDEYIWIRANGELRGMWKLLGRAAREAGFEVKVIAYFRGQDQFLSSTWAQRVKSFTGEHGKYRWEEMRRESAGWKYLDYYACLEEIAAVFGRDHIIARVYDRAHFAGGDITSDFLSVLGLEMCADFVPARMMQNPSIMGNSLEIKRIINTLPLLASPESWEERQRMMRHALACDDVEREYANFSVLSDGERREILERYAESNRRLARDYFGDANLRLFSLPENSPPKWTPENPWMPEAIVRFFGMLALERQREINELKRGKQSRGWLRRRALRVRRMMIQHLR